MSVEPRLLGEFENTPYDDWRRAVEAELKGVPFEKRLVSSTPENIPLQPLYTFADVKEISFLNSFPGFPPYARGSRAAGYLDKSWDISQELDFASPAEFNEAARTSVERGLTALNVVLDKATRNGHDPDWSEPGEVGAGGLSIASLDDLDRAFQGIDLEKISLFIRSGASAMPVAALLVALARKRGQKTENLRGCIEMDPLGVLSHEGRLPQSLDGAYREMAELLRWAAAHAPALQTICVHTRAWHESGASAVQELAFGLATGVDYVRAMAERGIPVDTIAPRIRFALTAGTRFFMEIAKVRAARILWSQAVAAFGGGVEAQRLKIHVRTSLRNKTVYDPHVNILRATVEAFAGVLGGCDSLQVGAFDEALRTPDDFSRRLARNTQLVLAKECSLAGFIDPAGGSWYVEKLTQELAERAWTLFQAVEYKGGMARAMEREFPQEEIAKAGAAQKKLLEQRRLVLLGTNEFSNPAEKRPSAPSKNGAAFQKKRRQQIIDYRTRSEDGDNQKVLQLLTRIVERKNEGLFDACVNAAGAGATLGEITRSVRISSAAPPPCRPVAMERLARSFENLRNAVAAHAAATAAHPRVFLANMGPSAQHRARADFSRNFFEIAGLDVIYSKGFSSVEDAADAAAAAKPVLAVLCSTDETYPDLVPEFVRAVKQRLPGIVTVLAGYPADQVDLHKQAGIDGFIHLKANVLETLTELLKKGGIPLGRDA